VGWDNPIPSHGTIFFVPSNPTRSSTLSLSIYAWVRIKLFILFKIISTKIKIYFDEEKQIIGKRC
jgi:hypothetical protein